MAATRDQAIAALTAAGAPFELASIEHRGVPLRVFANAPESMRDILAATAVHGDRDFLVYEGERTTFREHLAIVAGLAGWLADEHGVGKGDRVAIGMRNYPEWVMSFWATMSLGAIAVPLNAWWLGPELEYAITDSGCKALLLDGERLERLGPHLADARGGRAPSCAAPRGDVPDGVVRWEDAARAASTSAGRCPTWRSGPTTTPRSSTRRARPARRRAPWPRTATTSRTS